jgi:hypothetical protein
MLTVFEVPLTLTALTPVDQPFDGASYQPTTWCTSTLLPHLDGNRRNKLHSTAASVRGFTTFRHSYGEAMGRKNLRAEGQQFLLHLPWSVAARSACREVDGRCAELAWASALRGGRLWHDRPDIGDY